jgi:bifunctional glutamyl/prolyl-tRNA synthetase
MTMFIMLYIIEKNEQIGTKTVWYGPKMLIDYADAETINEGDLVTFMDWGNMEIVKIEKLVLF